MRVAPDSPERETVEACRRAALGRLSGRKAGAAASAREEELRRRILFLELENRRLNRALDDSRRRDETKRNAPAARGGAETRR